MISPILQQLANYFLYRAHKLTDPSIQGEPNIISTLLDDIEINRMFSDGLISLERTILSQLSAAESNCLVQKIGKGMSQPWSQDFIEMYRKRPYKLPKVLVIL